MTDPRPVTLVFYGGPLHGRTRTPAPCLQRMRLKSYYYGERDGLGATHEYAVDWEACTATHREVHLWSTKRDEDRVYAKRRKPPEPPAPPESSNHFLPAKDWEPPAKDDREDDEDDDTAKD